MKTKHLKILQSVLKTPTEPGIAWNDIEKALIAIGAEVTEGRGSRVCVKLNGIRAVFHRPHPRKEADKGAVAYTRKFLIAAGVEYVDI
jgi:hypothetical protein